MYITAVTNPTCISVSGKPDTLATFQEKYLPRSATLSRHAPIHTLYHSPDLLDVKNAVMQDVQRRNIKFPTYSSLHRPLCSPTSGAWLSASQQSAASTLAEDVVDMTLLFPVNFDSVIDQVTRDLTAARATSIKLINVGPSNALSRTVARSLTDIRVDSLDWSSGSATDTASVPRSMDTEVSSREAVAIVGMAVKFPGADDASGLWSVLEQGLNTVSEVGLLRQ